jgi:methyl-accepting chemotaxis protein
MRLGLAHKKEQIMPSNLNAPGNGAVPPNFAEMRDANRIAQLEAELAHCRHWVRKIEEVTSEAANGNLEARLLHAQDAGDFAVLARSVNHLLDMTDAFLREAGATLEYASQAKFFRRVLLRGMRGTFRHKSQLINAAIEKTAQNTSSLKEVERLVSQSAELTAGAAEESRQANAVVKQLYEASEKIGNVVKFISSIAWKTNLLSLNAAIEAARAGNAGLGFKVVAQEAKQLAGQTSSAADEITREIALIHEEVSRTTKAIESIDQTISKLKEISATIEQAVVERNVQSGKTSGRVLARSR